MKKAIAAMAMVGMMAVLLPGAASAYGSEWETWTAPCGMPASTTGLAGDLYTDDGATVWLNTVTGEAYVTCRFEIPPDLRPERRIRVKGFDCGWPETWESAFWARPRGTAMAYCHGLVI